MLKPCLAGFLEKGVPVFFFFVFSPAIQLYVESYCTGLAKEMPTKSNEFLINLPCTFLYPIPIFTVL